MKMTKRLAAIAATAVMAMTSVVGMSASAIEESNFTTEVIARGSLESILAVSSTRGYYYSNLDSTSFIGVDINNNNKIMLEKVYLLSEKKYIRGETTSGIDDTEDENSSLTMMLNGTFMTSENGRDWTKTQLWQIPLQCELGVVKNWLNQVQYYQIKVPIGVQNGITLYETYTQSH